MYKKVINGKKAIFFDLDGTVVKDTPSLMKDAVQKVLNDDLKAAYLSAEEYMFSGLPISKSWESILKHNSFSPPRKANELVDITYKYFIEKINKIELSPTDGFWDFIYEIKEEKGLKTALTTNSPKLVVDAVLSRINASKAFDVIVYGDDVKKIKPHPDMYKRALKSLGLKPKDVTAFEDSLAGAQAAASAKIDLVIIWDGETPRKEFPGKILLYTEDFSDLPGKLDEDWEPYMRRRAEESREEKAKYKAELKNQ